MQRRTAGGDANGSGEEQQMSTVTLSSRAEWRLFPPSVKRTSLSVGDEVFIRTKSAKEVGKKGVIFDFEKVDIPTAAPGPVDSAGTSFEDKTTRRDGGNDGNKEKEEAEGYRREVDRTTKWRDVKKQKKKKKKPKKWEETRALVRIPADQGGNANPFDCRVRPSRLVPIYKVLPSVDRSGGPAAVSAPPLLLLLTSETSQFRVLAASQVRPSDRILEIGCSTGETTVVLAKYAPLGDVVALDIGADMVERTKERFQFGLPDSSTSSTSSRPRAKVAVHKIDPFLDPRGAVDAALAAPPRGGDDESESSTDSHVNLSQGTDDTIHHRAVDAVFIDIGGNREARGVLRMIAFVRTEFSQPPRLIVVKSQALVAELTANPTTKETANGEDYDDDGGATGAVLAKSIRRPGYCSDDGRITEGDLWFRMLLASNNTTAESSSSNVRAAASTEEEDAPHSSSQSHIPKHFHPNKAPLRLSPTDGVTPICRYHNYHREGCKKAERCPYEHAICHWCLRSGHVALSCDNVGEFSRLR